MGFLGPDYEVDRYKSELEQAKKRKEGAKQSGMYKTAGRNIVLPDGRRVNNYDGEIFYANMRLKDAEAKLAKEKAENKSKSSSSKSSSSSKKSSSSSSSKSSGRSGGGETFAATVKKSAEEAKLQMQIEAKSSAYYSALKEKYPIEDESSETTLLGWMMELSKETKRLEREKEANEGDELEYGIAKRCYGIAEGFYEDAYRKIIKINVKRQVTAIQKQYPIETASDTELAKMLPGLLAELKEREQTRRNSQGDRVARDIARACYSEVRSYATNACLRLKKLNPTLFKQPEVIEVVKQINPALGNTLLSSLFQLFFGPFIWLKDKMKKLEEYVDKN